MGEDYIDKVMKSLENEDNEGIMQWTNAKIRDQTNNILQKLQLDRENLRELNSKLKGYRYVDELVDLQFGRFLRWIPLSDPERIRLTNGARVCDIKILNEGVHIVCKNNVSRFMQLKLDENLVFQKLTEQEKIILKTLDYLKD
jgi:hypothetical protein